MRSSAFAGALTLAALVAAPGAGHAQYTGPPPEPGQLDLRRDPTASGRLLVPGARVRRRSVLHPVHGSEHTQRTSP